MKDLFISKIASSFFLVLMASFAGCGTAEAPEENTPIKATVTVIHPSQQDLTEYIKLNGITLFQKKDNIRATTTGYVTALNLRQGDHISTGQLFCTIGTKEQQALKSINDSSLAKFQKPLMVLSSASGIITSIATMQGDYVTEGDVLATVSEPASLIVQVNVPYEYNEYVKAGKACDIILPDGKVISTAITGSMPQVDEGSQAQSFFIRLPDISLPENLNVTIRLAHEQKKNVLCVPSIALQTDEMQKEFWLMKILNDSLAVKIPVKTGLQNDSLTEIISDKISPADLIILEGAYGLGDSTSVNVEKQ
jgi:biotin carboxyl carrier protein